MRKFIKNLYENTIIGNLLISPPKMLYDIYRFHIISERKLIKRTFIRELGYIPNLENPKTFNEKIQWLKMKDKNPSYSLYADKFAVRVYIKEMIGKQYLIPMVYHTDNPNNITSENIPDFPCIIKTNHGSSGGIMIRDKSKTNWKSVRKKLSTSMKYNYYYNSKEWQYKNIKPQILVEKLLLDVNSNIPNDYKFHCFNGKVEFIQVDIDRHKTHKRNIYDTNWRFINCQLKFENGDPIDKPHMLNKMRSLAEKLAANFQYIRVDFYNLGSQVYFGELTFHPGSGFEPFRPIEWDRIFGDKLNLENLK